MNRRQAKTRIKRELRLKKWPKGDPDPRLVRAVTIDLRDAIADVWDHAILYGNSRPAPKPECRRIKEVLTGIHPKRKRGATQ